MNIESLKSYTDNVTLDFTWSGDVNSSEQFIIANFKEVHLEGHCVYLCHVDNGVAVGNYLSRYFNLNYVDEIEKRLSPVCDYWFSQAFECCEPSLYGLDDWIQHIIEFFISKDRIIKFEHEDSEFLALIDFDQYEAWGFDDEILQELHQILQSELAQIPENLHDEDI